MPGFAQTYPTTGTRVHFRDYCPEYDEVLAVDCRRCGSPLVRRVSWTEEGEGWDITDVKQGKVLCPRCDSTGPQQ